MYGLSDFTHYRKKSAKLSDFAKICLARPEEVAQDLFGDLETLVPVEEDALVSTPLGRRHPAATKLSCGDGTADRNRL